VSDLFDPAATGRVVIVMRWVLTPSISVVTSFLLFQFVPLGASIGRRQS
jgi:PiT family inorganic phosphate transporter